MKTMRGPAERAMLLSLVTLAFALPAHAQSGPTLIDVVRAATESFRDPGVAVAEGWKPMTGCVSGPQSGAMGTHFINETLVLDGELNAARPEALLYERKGGGTHLVAVEYIVLAEAWHAANGAAPPVLRGQHFHYVGSPNRYGLPPFYELHVWAWKENPSGAFADWHPHVTCSEVTGR